MRIGILDSGLGGLTVAAAIAARFPGAELLYVGDTARVPYGSRASETIVAFAGELLDHLLDQGVDAVVIACNTIAAVALPTLAARCPVPLIDVIEPTVRAAVARGVRSVAVIGTRASMGTHVYRDRLIAIDGSLQVRELACPLFVPVVEEGYVGTLVGQDIVREQLTELRADPPQLLILGCTHYPYLEAEIQRVLPGTVLLNSAVPTAAALAELLDGDSSAGDGTLSITLTSPSASLERLLPPPLQSFSLTVLPPEELAAR